LLLQPNHVRIHAMLILIPYFFLTLISLFLLFIRFISLYISLYVIFSNSLISVSARILTSRNRRSLSWRCRGWICLLGFCVGSGVFIMRILTCCLLYCLVSLLAHSPHYEVLPISQYNSPLDSSTSKLCVRTINCSLLCYRSK
jgi:hypothetical protein